MDIIILLSYISIGGSIGQIIYKNTADGESNDEVQTCCIAFYKLDLLSTDREVRFQIQLDNVKSQLELHRDKDVHLQTQVDSVKNKLNSLSETAQLSQFQQRCLIEFGAYRESLVTQTEYCFIKSTFTWNDGKTECQFLEAYLLEINSKAEQNWLKDKVSGEKWWTGGIKDRSRNVWIWEHSGTELEFSNWDSDRSQPGGGKDENCILSEDGLWHDYPCDDTFKIICEKEK